MKKLVYCCLSVVLILALLCPVGALAAEAKEAEPDKAVEADPPGGKASVPYDHPYGVYGLPTLEEWGGDGIYDIIWYMETVAYFYAEIYSYDPAFTEMPLWEVLDPAVETLEEFLEKYELDEDEYAELELLWEELLEEARQAHIWSNEWYASYLLEQLERLGGIPGIVNVMVNGDFIKFAETAVPERKDGHTFVPAKLFLEALGAEVGFDNQTRAITADFGDCSAVFVIGSDTMVITADGEEREADIGAAPYISPGGSSYIPARAVAEAFGLDVYWDSSYETVVVIDTAGLIAEIDKDFTTANKLLGMAMNPASANGAGILKNVLSVAAAVKFFDSLDGDKEAALGADMTVVTDGENFNITVNIDMKALLDLIIEAFPYPQEDIDEIMDSEEMSILEALFDAKAELIYNYDEDTLYIWAPFLSTLAPEVPAGAWISVAGATEYMEDLLYAPDYYGLTESTEDGEPEDGQDGGGPSLGRLIYSNNSLYTVYNQIRLYEYIMSDVNDLRVFMGDDKIKVNGDSYSLKLTLDDIMGASDDDPYSSYYYYSYMQTAFDLEVNIKTDGEAILGISGKFFMRESYYYLSGVTQIKCEFDISPESAKISFELHEKNSYVVSMDVGLSTEESSGLVRLAPPEGAKIVPIEDIIQEGYEEYNPGAIVPLRVG